MEYITDNGHSPLLAFGPSKLLHLDLPVHAFVCAAPMHTNDNLDSVASRVNNSHGFFPIANLRNVMRVTIRPIVVTCKPLHCALIVVTCKPLHRAFIVVT